MLLDKIPLWAFSVIILLIVLIAIELGFRLGQRNQPNAKPGMDGPITVTLGAVLGLLGFMLAFTFGIVYNRFEVRKDLVRQEAAAVGRVWLRSDFLSDPDRAKTKDLLRKYVDIRIHAASVKNANDLNLAKIQSNQIQLELWSIAVANVHKDMISGLAPHYVQALNDVIDIHGRRVAIGVEDRIPFSIWLSLLALVVVSMAFVGYLTGLKASKRSIAVTCLAVSFTIIFILISALERPLSHLFYVSQKPLIELKEMIMK